MKVDQLSKYTRLKNVLSASYYNEFTVHARNVLPNRFSKLVTIYSVFIDLTMDNNKAKYGALDIFNSNKKLNIHFKRLIGFIYSDLFDSTLEVRYKSSLQFKRIFHAMADNYSVNLDEFSIKLKDITKDVTSCIDAFNSIVLDIEQIEYYSGWTVNDKEGNLHNIHLSTIHDHYGKELTQTFHRAISDFIFKQKKTSAKSIISQLTILLNMFTELCKTCNELLLQLQADRSHLFFEQVLNITFARAIAEEHDKKLFFIMWSNKVKYFTDCFIETHIFDSPTKPFLTPRFKEPTDNCHNFSIGGALTKDEKERWLVAIPLRIKDDEALDIILQRLKRDLEHIRNINHRHFIEINQRQTRNETYIKVNSVKPLPSDKKNSTRYPFPIGEKHLGNTVATFYHHSFGAKDRYPDFLGFSSNSRRLTELLNLPVKETHNILISLLILEHPSITPSWLNKWELYNKSGERVGFKQVGEQFVAISYKDRRGSALSQQVVTLNNYSRSIVELLIKQTQLAREWLKRKDDNTWRYMLLTADFKRVILPKSLLANITSLKKEYLNVASYRHYIPALHSRAQKIGNFPNIIRINAPVLNQILSQPEAEKLSKIVTPRSIRKSRGLQIYLETRSLRAVAEALGHKTVDVKLLESYLPKPLMDYFNERWIRQFQNTIVYEALKDSHYLFDALDFKESELEEFLINHGLGELPDNINKATNSAINEENQTHIESINEVVYTLSTPLLQVLIAIQSIADITADSDIFKPVFKKWYEAAAFILTSLNLKNRIGKDTALLLENAKNNPISVKHFKENLLCQ